MSENYTNLSFEQMSGHDLIAFREHYNLSRLQMASFLMISKRTYGRMEMSEDNLMTVLNADQRYILKTYVGSQGLSLWLDYLGMSFKMRTPEMLIKLFFDNRLDLFVKRDSGRYGYNVAYSFGGLSYITIYGKRDSPESFIDFSGSGIRLMEMLLIGQGLVWSHFINIALSNGGKATRIGFCVLMICHVCLKFQNYIKSSWQMSIRRNLRVIHNIMLTVKMAGFNDIFWFTLMRSLF